MNTNVISLIGLGKLGLPLLTTFAKNNQRIIGGDVDVEKINTLSNRKVPFFEPRMEEYFNEGYENMEFTESFEDVVNNADVYIILVNTPSKPNGEFSNEYIESALTRICDAVNKSNKDDFLIILSSTVMPTSCEGFITLVETRTRRAINEGFGFVHVPDLVALGNVIHDFENPDVTILGQSDERYGDIAETIYSKIIKNGSPIVRMSLLESEISKVSLNAYITMKISFFNFIGNICEKYGSNPKNISKALGCDKRISPYYSNSGLAFGGTCFPRDTWAFIKMSDELGLNAVHIKATQQINEDQNTLLYNKVSEYRDKNIGILGLSFKPKTTVTTESPGYILYQRLKEVGYNVYGFDPLVETDFHDIAEFIECCDVIVITHNDKTLVEGITPDKIVINPWGITF